MNYCLVTKNKFKLLHQNISCLIETLKNVIFGNYLKVIYNFMDEKILFFNLHFSYFLLLIMHRQSLVNLDMSNWLYILFFQNFPLTILGVIFDYRLNWNTHVGFSISKSKKALFALRLLKRFFNGNEMRSLLDTNFYSIL